MISLGGTFQPKRSLHQLFYSKNYPPPKFVVRHSWAQRPITHPFFGRGLLQPVIRYIYSTPNRNMKRQDFSGYRFGNVLDMQDFWSTVMSSIIMTPNQTLAHVFPDLVILCCVAFGTCGRRLQTGDSLNLNLEKNNVYKRNTKFNSSPLKHGRLFSRRSLPIGAIGNFSRANC